LPQNQQPKFRQRQHGKIKVSSGKSKRRPSIYDVHMEGRGVMHVDGGERAHVDVHT